MTPLQFEALYEAEWTELETLLDRVLRRAGTRKHGSVEDVPGARVAWTGNLIFGADTIPWAQSGNIARYRDALE